MDLSSHFRNNSNNNDNQRYNNKDQYDGIVNIEYKQQQLQHH